MGLICLAVLTFIENQTNRHICVSHLRYSSHDLLKLQEILLPRPATGSNILQHLWVLLGKLDPLLHRVELVDTGEASMLKIDENLGIESVISGDPPCKDCNAIFTTIPLIPSVFNSDHLCIASYKQEMHRAGNF